MEDERKSKSELIEELSAARSKIDELSSRDDTRKSVGDWSES